MNMLVVLMRVFFCANAVRNFGAAAFGEAEGKGEVEETLMDW